MKTDFMKNYEIAEPVLSKLYTSRLRANILNIISDKPISLADLARAVSVSPPNVSAKLKELMEDNLVEKSDSGYELTEWGRAMHRETRKSIEKALAFENLKDFWTTRKTDEIPEHLWDEIGKLKNCKLVKMNEQNEAAVEESAVPLMISVDKFLYGVSPFFHEQLFEVFMDVCINKDIDFRGIHTKPVLNEMAKRFGHKLEVFCSRDNVKIYEIDSTSLAFMVSEKYLSMGIESKEVPALYMDMDMQGTDSNAIEWGRMLFEHLLKRAKPTRLEDYL